ncbi:hypothetical protein Ancab_001823 [Ancistrocladus abbreviatus]
MATTAREGAYGREKKGILPSHSPMKKTTKSPSLGSSDHKTSPSFSEKPVPHYLKPTMSSRRESLSLAKRPSTDSYMQSPILDKRRSFSNPPSPARLQKALQGTTPTDLAEKASRSISFTNRRTPPFNSRPIQRFSKAPTKDAKIESTSSSIKSKTIKRSTTLGTKRDGSAKVGSSSKKVSKSVTPERSNEAHDRDLRLDRVISEDEVERVVHEVQFIPNISKMSRDKEQLGDPQVETESKNAEKEKAKAQEKEEEEEQNTHLCYDLADKAIVEEGEAHENEQEHGDHGKEVNIDKHPLESIEKPANQQLKNEVEEEETVENTPIAHEDNVVNEEVITKEELKEEFVNDEKKEEESGEEVNMGEEMENAVARPKPEAQSLKPVKLQQQPTSARKKEAQVYNDVIEETASKLMENRKNKVRALAGAFETVISLQEAK